MILCVTPNPALDRTVVVPDFTAGKVSRAQSTLVAAGGKGVNVARAIRVLGGDALCAGFLGGTMGRYLSELAENEGIPAHWTRVTGETRNCLIVADPNAGEATVVNEQGPTVTPEDWARLQDDIAGLLNDEITSVCLSGSLPPGSPLDTYLDLINVVLQYGKAVWVDTSGAALQVAHRIPGIALKVNGDEAGTLLGRSVTDPESALSAALELLGAGLHTVVLTLGSQGAVMVHSAGRWWAKPPVLKVIDPVGSGDSFLAGLVLSLNTGYSPDESLCRAVASGAANALSVGGGQFPLADFDRILSETELQAL